MKQGNGAIVLGGHVQALGIVRILGRDGVQSMIIANTKKNIARHSKFCTNFILSKDEDLLEMLIKLGDNKRFERWVIFPTNDFHVKLLSVNREILDKHFITAADKWDSVKIFYNKRYTYKLADQANIPFPKTWFPNSENDLDNISPPFPCIIKPAVMVDFYTKIKRKVFVCRNRSELRIYYRKALEIIPSDEIIVQEIIPGSGLNQYSACILFLLGEIYVSLTACRMRQHPVDFGNATTYAEAVDIPELVDHAVTLLKKSNYSGLCEVEFKKDDRDGKYKLLEVNPRTWKWHSISNKAGTPFLKTYFDFLLGNKIFANEGFKSASFVHCLTDFPVRLCLLKKGFKFWNRLISPCENAVWARDDIKPWLFEKLYIPYLIFSR